MVEREVVAEKSGRGGGRIGDFVRISLGDGWYSYGRVLRAPLFAFYDVRVREPLGLEELQLRPLLFRVWVMKSALTSGRWVIIGNRPLEKSVEQSPAFFKQDPITNDLSIYHEGKERRATREECESLERAAVWDPTHVEDRLRDHYAGVPNKWVEALRPRW